MDSNTHESAPQVLIDADIREFIEIYKKEFKKTLSPKDAREMATGLLELYAVLAKPLPSESARKTSPNSETRANTDVQKVQFRSSPLTKVIDILPPRKPEM